ncbi:hypothetical protein GCM10011610_56330 [Nocardia rhizosphaerihabitans]|uniref:Uncharacterized protein n=1 Tax=Nocardia rhizosphaerihabitans TaxID=1691570 RepID=A0ABQ2KWQ4_9NOCA|nr:hypothetical protein GCM10011610_56330 [Nocardia rhizosphaerihabitans]
MTDLHPKTLGPARLPLFSTQPHCDATPSTVDRVPGNQLPTFLAAPAAHEQDRPC